MKAILFALALLALPAHAQTPMTAAEFEAYVTGRTLTFGLDGTVYGVEEFRAGRQTTWAFMTEECRKGEWFPRDEQICFIYEDDEPGIEHCWIFWEGDGGLNARFMGDGDTVLYEALNSPQPLVCRGPEVGV